MKELLKERIEMYKKEIERVSDEINEDVSEWKFKRLEREHSNYVAIRDELQYLLLRLESEEK